ncbi:tyrosine-type recombinase/integrase [Legionella septentrionalis]|uniref:tyrosine-type recombinase/integrase n=1 Tax=Legionella septentrionalis TaxID=2498109 RepID=UPI000F8E0A94|nr:integrase arm-type DNA-binding domain-containing protein [Legionella septentrionalis]RUR12404.1 DUF4102 domain-containing protein [Legionella septentrionalis]
MKLTYTKVKELKPKEKVYKLADGKGLYIQVTPQGSKYWRLKYRINNKERVLALGVFPDVSLAMAREKRDEARRLIANEIDPNDNKKALKSAQTEREANSFEVIAREWFAKYKTTWVDSHAIKIIQRLERDIFKLIGDKPITEVTAPVLLSTIRRIEEKGNLDTAHRALGNCSQIFRYAIATGRAERDPAQDLRGALPPVKPKHFAALTEPKQLGEILRVLDTYHGSPTVRAALKLAPLVFVRPGELRQAKWGDINFETREWRYIVTKTQTPHIVPLAKQAVLILEELYPLTKTSEFVFPSPRNNKAAISDNALLAALRRMDISKEEVSIHGFRASARTLLDEVLEFRPDIIEHQLAHALKDPNGRAYNRTKHLDERKRMMQAWADYLDKLKGLGVKNV